MAKITVEEQPEYATLPVDSIIHVKVDECTVKTVNGQNGDWEKLEFKFKVLGIQSVSDQGPIADYENLIGGPIWGSVPFKLTNHPENRLRLWAEAILGMELGVGYEMDTDAFLRRECRAVTGQYEAKARDRYGNRVKKHQVESLLEKGVVQNQQPNPWPTQQPQQQPQQQWSSQGQPAQDPWATPGVQPSSVPAGSWEEPPF